MNDLTRKPDEIDIPRGFSPEAMGDIQKSWLVKLFKTKIGNIFAEVASSSGTPEQKAREFMELTSDMMSRVRKDLENNSKIPGGRVDDAIFYIIAQGVVDKLSQSNAGAITDKKPVRPEAIETSTSVGIPSNVKPVEAGLIKLFRNFHPAGGGGISIGS